MDEGEEVWIAKPSLTNQALSVCIFDHVQQLRSAVEAAPDLREWVLQRCAAMHDSIVSERMLIIYGVCGIMWVVLYSVYAGSPHRHLCQCIATARNAL